MPNSTPAPQATMLLDALQSALMSAPAAPKSPLPLPQLPAGQAAHALHDLANAVAGEVRLGAHDRMLYSTDASLYQVEPLGVVIPRDADDVCRAVAWCAQRRVPILPRGGGTSLAGQCTNQAVVIDVSPSLRGVGAVDTDARTIRVQAGVTVDDLNDSIARSGLFFAPDPATARHATIGGCIGNNAAGARSILYGRTSENVVSIGVCLSDGTRAEFGPGSARTDARVQAITRNVVRVVRAHERLIRERFPKTVRRNAGYGLDMILQQLDAGTAPEDVSLAPLLCGSEGTLALTLEATLRLVPRPGARCLAVAGFADLDEAISAVAPILATGPSAVEMLDDMILGLASRNAEYRKYVDLMPRARGGEPKAVLYVEYFGDDARALEDRCAALRATLEAWSRSAPRTGNPQMHVHHNASAMLSAWKLRKAGEPLLHGVPGSRKPLTFIEDNAIPVERLGEFVKRLREIVTEHGTIASYWAHASVGVLHVRPLLDIHTDDDRARLRDIALRTADLARELGGVMSGEHGDGRVRGPLLERFFGPELLAAFKEVKRAFDPHNLLNPGNIVDLTGDNPRPIESMTQRLRVEPSPGRPVLVPEGVQTYYRYDSEHGFDSAVEMCNGAGVCRKKQGGTMCPSYMATLDERHSTRGRGNALRLAITGQAVSGQGVSSGSQDAEHRWRDGATRETLDLCLSCKACKTECPSNVDIAKLKAEFTAQRYRTDAPPLATRLMGSVRTLLKLGSFAPGVANWCAEMPLGRALANRLLGLHPRRSLPPVARSLGASWREQDRVRQVRTTKEARTTDAPSVVLFGDCFTMFSEPHIGLAMRRVLEACGYRVLLADAGCCARAKISLGLLEQAIDEVNDTIDVLLPIAKDPRVRAILVAEPSCLSAIKDDWLSLKLRSSAQDREVIASKCFLPEEYVHKFWNNHPVQPRFRACEHEVILHAHCHQKALWGAQTSADALRRTAQGTADQPSRVTVLDSGCCGMAGSFGYTRDRFDLSMKIGELTLLPAARGASEHAIITAPGASCRHQIHDGAGRTALHPIEVLAHQLED